MFLGCCARLGRRIISCCRQLPASFALNLLLASAEHLSRRRFPNFLVTPVNNRLCTNTVHKRNVLRRANLVRVFRYQAVVELACGAARRQPLDCPIASWAPHRGCLAYGLFTARIFSDHWDSS